MRSCCRLSAAIVATCAIALAAPQVAAAALPQGFFGVTPAASPNDLDLQRMGQAGVQVLRQPFGWAELQPTPNGPYDFREFDRIVAGAASNGVEVVPFVFGTPEWARNCSAVPAFYCDRVTPLLSAAGTAGWPALLSALVGRYGSRGTFWSNPLDSYSPPFRPITRWQVWNEPNSPKYLRPAPTPKAYYDLLKVSSPAIRSQDPSARILLGGLYGIPPRPGMTMWKFLDRLYRFKGAQRLFDAVALHPYSHNVRGIEMQVSRGREIIRKHHDKAKIYLTEIGWGSGTNAGPAGRGLYKGIAGQGASLAASFSWAIRNRGRYGIGGVDWFSWRDLPPGGGGDCVLCESFGLLNVDFSPKPSMAAFTRFTGGQP